VPEACLVPQRALAAQCDSLHAKGSRCMQALPQECYLREEAAALHLPSTIPGRPGPAPFRDYSYSCAPVNAQTGAARLGQQAARQQRAQAGQRGEAQGRGGLARAPGQWRQQRGAREAGGAAA